MADNQGFNLFGGGSGGPGQALDIGDLVRAGLGFALGGLPGGFLGFLADPSVWFGTGKVDHPMERYTSRFEGLPPPSTTDLARWAPTTGVSPEQLGQTFGYMDPSLQWQAQMNLEQTLAMNEMQREWYDRWRQFGEQGYQQMADVLSRAVGRIY